MRAVALLAILGAGIGLALGTAVDEASAHVGIGTGFGPRLRNPLTPHVGPVYWTPGDKATAAASSRAENAHSELSEFLGKARHEQRKIKCAKLHAQYMGRHGLTTPRPLKGSSGCAKYARDEAYWQTRRGERHSLTTPGNAIAYAVHNTILPW